MAGVPDQLVLDTGSRDVANFGSLMFKITGTEDSFLVCGAGVLGRDGGGSDAFRRAYVAYAE